MAGHRNNARGFDDQTKSVSRFAGHNGIMLFHQKHVFSTKNNPICGVTLYQWLHILLPRVQYVQWLYLPRVLFITLLSLVNSLLSIVESIVYPDYVIDQVQLPEDPVFIIGHPRTGTTLIHNLLASDSDSFYYCTTFCAGFPSCFLWFESIGKKLFSGIIEKTRPMDSMPLHFDLPQEDECAVNLLSHGRSYYMPLWFMSQETKFRKYLDFSREDGASVDDEDKWSKAFVYLMKKLTLRHQRDSRGHRTCNSRARLLIKSPIHTARVPLLRRIFPKARFVYVHRHPYDVLRSAAHMADTAYWYCYLNTPSDRCVSEFIYWQFEHMWIKYNNAALLELDSNSDSNSSSSSSGMSGKSSRALREDVLEVSFTDLASSPSKTVEQIYRHIGIDWDEDKDARFKRETEALQGYKKNEFHSAIPPDVVAVMKERWGRYFDAFHYQY